MKVRIELFATLRDRFGIKDVEVECGEGLESAFRSASKLLGEEFLKEVFDERGRIRSDRIITINGRNIKDLDEVRLREGDRVSIFPPLAGGY